MQIERTEMSVEAILDLEENHMLTPNLEYQRGQVWTQAQQKKLIDSVMRGYPLPVFYLHHIRRGVANYRRDDFQIIDGQQRIVALRAFHQGAYALFDPIHDNDKARFPRFIQKIDCPWGGKQFADFTDDLRQQFLETMLPIAKITSDNEDEVRDLFVRLQAGFPLNAQEKRDAYPGQFADFVLHLGGKPQVDKYPGHAFFTDVLRMKPRQDRGKARQLAAQIAMLFLERRLRGRQAFTDINAKAIDDYYYSNIDFDADTADCRRLREILNEATETLRMRKGPKVQGHQAIHLVLLLDSLWDDYTRSWRDKLVEAVDEFSGALARANRTKDSDEPSEYWLRYGQWTRTNSDRGERIGFRHEFYSRTMLALLSPQGKDPKRAFGLLEREVIWYRDRKCQICAADVAWDEAEIHHVQEHADGGPTVVENGALVHSHCHPKGRDAVRDFARKWEELHRK